jgi:dTDP-4-dehydrorhamnose reductase
MPSPCKVLILGGSGFLGFNLVRLISRSSNYEVYATYNEGSPDFSYNFLYFNCSQSDLGLLLSELSPDLVINCVALANVDRCEANPDLANEYNANFPLKLAKYTAKMGIFLIHISTDHFEVDPTWALSESEITVTVNEYGKSKLKGESLVLTTNKDSFVVRTNFFGLGSNDKSFVQDIINSIESFGFYQAFQNVYFTPVSIRELWFFMELLFVKRFTGLINIASSVVLTKFEFAVLLCKELKIPESCIEGIDVADSSKVSVPRPKNMALSNYRLIQVTGAQPNSIRNMIKEVISDKL